MRCAVMRSAAAVGLMIGVAGCMPHPLNEGASPALVGRRSGSGVPMRFDWAPPCRVPVIERIEKQGQSAVFSYDVTLQRTREPGVLELRTEQLRPLEINGVDATSAGLQAEGRTMMALAAALPALRISSDGQFLGITGEAELVERLLALSGARPGTLESDRLRQTLTSPQTLSTLRERAGDTWRGWVGAWVGVDLAPGEELDAVEEVAVPGKVLRAPVRYQRDPDPVDAPGMAKLTRTAVFSGPEMDAFMANVLVGLGRATGSDAERDMVRSARRTTTITAATDPATLRPGVVSYVTETSLELKAQPAQTQRQVRAATFDWLRARGCR